MVCSRNATPQSPDQKDIVERVIRTIKDQCVHRHRFETLQLASQASADWIDWYNHLCLRQAFNMKTPAGA